MPKFISIMWSEGVSEEEARILLGAVEQVLKWLYLRQPANLFDPAIRVRAFGTWVIPALVPDKPYWGTQWYVEQSYDEEVRRVIAPVFLELVRREPWQRAEPHFDLALVDEDLTDFPAPLARLQPDHYCLGSSFPGTAAVFSLYRLRLLADERTRQLALARLTRHHLGHVLGIPQFTRQGQTKRLGLELHCVNPCVMRHAATVEELARLALEEAEMGWAFCPQCTSELHSVVAQYTYQWS